MGAVRCCSLRAFVFPAATWPGTPRASCRRSVWKQPTSVTQVPVLQLPIAVPSSHSPRVVTRGGCPAGCQRPRGSIAAKTCITLCSCQWHRRASNCRARWQRFPRMHDLSGSRHRQAFTAHVLPCMRTWLSAPCHGGRLSSMGEPLFDVRAAHRPWRRRDRTVGKP
jgi:hypothetical protein